MKSTLAKREPVTDSSVQRDIVREAVREYAQVQPQVVELSRRLAAWLQSMLDDSGIDYLSVAARGKSVASFAMKTTWGTSASNTTSARVSPATSAIRAPVTI